jgi:hypothetical protein
MQDGEETRESNWSERSAFPSLGHHRQTVLSDLQFFINCLQAEIGEAKMSAMEILGT